MAFASIQDSAAVPALQRVLENDADVAARQAAALSLGQTPSAASVRALQWLLSNEKNGDVVSVALEAYGKVSPRWEPQLGLADTFVVARAWALYRCGLRGINSPEMNRQAVATLSRNSTAARRGAAQYLARGAKDFSEHAGTIAAAAVNDASPDVRMALALALGKLKSDVAWQSIRQLLQADPDYRVRVAAANAAQQFPATTTFADLAKALDDRHIQVAIAVSETLRAVATHLQSADLAVAARNTRHWRVQATLWEAALAGNADLAKEIATRADAAKDPYQKAWLIGALKRSVTSYGFVMDQLLKADTPVVRSAAADALVSMNRHKDFRPSMKKTFATLYEEALETGDAAVIGLVASALGDSTLGYKGVLSDHSFLRRARTKLSLPRDNEALQPLETAMAYFEGRSEEPVRNEFNHAIDWSLVASIAPDQRAVIKTTRGSITLTLHVEEAPGSVANFVALARDGYFNEKFFHRVVPNFVIQAGCNRGDGWGSEDYSIRSEFGDRRYTTGSVGMASAGKDTEGTQWFITHSPTPRLDGRYTLFASVATGMEVVHEIEVGDRILEITFP